VLAPGLLAGLGSSVSPITYALMALVVAALVVGDHRRMLRQYRHRPRRWVWRSPDEKALRAPPGDLARRPRRARSGIGNTVRICRPLLTFSLSSVLAFAVDTVVIPALVALTSSVR
jgi:hypothetical protein